MPSKTFYTDATKTEKILVKWGWNWKNINIAYNGQEIGQIANQKELKKGQSLFLPDGRGLHIRLTSFPTAELELHIEGKPVSGTAADPLHVLHQLFKLSLFFGCLNLALGLGAELLENTLLRDMGIGWGSMLFGALIIALSFGIRKGAAPALIATIALWGFEFVMAIWMVASGEIGGNPTSGLLIKAFIIMQLYRGFASIKKLNAQKEAAAQTA